MGSSPGSRSTNGLTGTTWGGPEPSITMGASKVGLRGCLPGCLPGAGFAVFAAGVLSGEALPVDGLPADGLPADGLPADGLPEAGLSEVAVLLPDGARPPVVPPTVIGAAHLGQ